MTDSQGIELSNPPPAPGVGHGEAIGHHGEFIQGLFKMPDGRLQRGLLTVPHPHLKSVVNFWPCPGREIRTRPGKREKAAAAGRLTLDYLGYHELGADLTIESNIRIGSGLGSSTADAIATIRATADALRRGLSRLDLCSLAIQAESASDAIVFDDQPVLFAHRDSRLIEIFPGDFPDLVIVGFDTGDEAVNTNDLKPARYSPEEIELFTVLRAATARAILNREVGLFCRCASLSAEINQRHLPRLRFNEIKWLAETCGALGFQVAHSGNIAGLLFAAGDTQAAIMAVRSLQHAGFTSVSAFHFSGGRAVR